MAFLYLSAMLLSLKVATLRDTALPKRPRFGLAFSQGGDNLSNRLCMAPYDATRRLHIALKKIGPRAGEAHSEIRLVSNSALFG